MRSDFFSCFAMDTEAIKTRRQQVLYDRKWKKFLGRVRVLRYIPFVKFVLAAGSMATGNVHKDSDFDVIVGSEYGRIFTVRFFAAAFFGLLGWRRKKLSHHESARDMICLNHFVTEKSYRLSPPHNAYWQMLYRRLVPVFGSDGDIREFLRANSDWAGEISVSTADLRYFGRQPARGARVIESVLSGRLGDAVEDFLKRFQISRIERGLGDKNAFYKPRIRYGDNELEFHPDTRRIEEFCV